MNSIIQVYSYSRCSTCRKALKWLGQNNLAHQIIDIINSPPSIDLIAKAIDQIDNRKLIFNTSGASYRALGAKTVEAMADEEAISALANDGKLIKRPFVVMPSGKIVLGFKPDIWDETML